MLPLTQKTMLISLSFKLSTYCPPWLRGWPGDNGRGCNMALTLESINATVRFSALFFLFVFFPSLIHSGLAESRVRLVGFLRVPLWGAQGFPCPLLCLFLWKAQQLWCSFDACWRALWHGVISSGRPPSADVGSGRWCVTASENTCLTPVFK